MYSMTAPTSYHEETERLNLGFDTWMERWSFKHKSGANHTLKASYKQADCTFESVRGADRQAFENMINGVWIHPRWEWLLLG